MSMTSRPRPELMLVDGRADRDAHLAAAGEDVDRAVLGRVDDEAVGARRLREAVDLLLQGDDLLARVLERAHEALVLRRQRRQARLDVGQPCLELTRALRRVSRHLAQGLDLGAQGCELAVSGSGDSGAGGTLGVWVADVIRHLGLLNPSLAHSDDSTLTPCQPMSSDVSASDRRTRRIVLSLLTRSPSASGVQASAGMSVDAVDPGTTVGAAPPRRRRGATPVSPVTPASVRVAVGALGRTALALGRDDAGGEATRRDEEAGVAVHPVLRTHGEALEVPPAHERLPGGRLGEAAVRADALGDPAQLGRRGDVADEHAAGDERVGDGVEALPRARACRGRRGRRCRPRRRSAATRRGRRR